MNGKKEWIAAAVELAVVLLATVAAFTWGQRAALIERGYTARGGEYTREEYTAAAANRDIMEALASIKQAVSGIGGSGDAEELAAAVERGLAL